MCTAKDSVTVNNIEFHTLYMYMYIHIQERMIKWDALLTHFINTYMHSHTNCHVHVHVVVYTV